MTQTRQATMVEWPREFSPGEWPEGALEKMDAAVLEELFAVRSASGIPMRPSGLLAAHVRERGNSRHSTRGGERLSDATDINVGTLDGLASVFRHAQRRERIGGIGLYFDTNEPMFHIDCRATRLVWLRHNGEYHYEVNDPAHFYGLLGKLLGGGQ